MNIAIIIILATPGYFLCMHFCIIASTHGISNNIDDNTLLMFVTLN